MDSESPNPMAGILIRTRTFRHRHAGENPSEDRDFSDGTTAQGTPKIVGNHQKLEEARIPREPSEGCLRFDFTRPSHRQREYTTPVKVLCYNSLRTLTDTSITSLELYLLLRKTGISVDTA